MTDRRTQDAPDHRALVSEFAGHVAAARASGGKLLAAVVVAALAGGVVFGAGYLSRPASKHQVTASPQRSPSVTVTSPAPISPAATPTPSPPASAPVPVTTVTEPAPPAKVPVTQAVQATVPAPVPQATPATPSGARPGPTSRGPRRDDSRTRFTAVAGYGCPASANAEFSEHGRRAGRLSGFLSLPSRGPRVPGCDGAFGAMPMSGSPTYNDPADYALWIFRTGSVWPGTCDIRVYVPADPSTEHVGGDPAVYQVFGSDSTGGPELGAFEVNQLAKRGRWVSEPSWPVTNGWLTVRLDSYGTDWSRGSATHARIAVSAIRVTCVR